MFSTYSKHWHLVSSKNAIDIYQQKWFPFATAAQLETILTRINFAGILKILMAFLLVKKSLEPETRYLCQKC